MKRKGFTLIELLAVIVILAIIALIAVPIVMNIITKANKSSFKNTAYGIIKAGELYYADQLLETNGMYEDKAFEFPNYISGLQIKGSLPSDGKMIVSSDGDVAIAISNGKYCVKKNYSDSDVIIDEDLDNCEITGSSIIYTNGIMTSKSSCIKTGTCDSGTVVNVKVNASENYDFYVIKDTGTKMNLIMNKNLGSNVAWINNGDYISAGGTNYGTYGNNEKGPLTALKSLEERTSGWSNISTMTYTLTDDGGANKYNSITRNNVRARMLTYTEATSLNCANTGNTCPSYLYSNTVNNGGGSGIYGYWLSSASSSSSSAWTITYYGSVYNGSMPISGASTNGVRPVINLSK